MKKLDSLELIKLKLINFHKNKAKSNLDYFSEIANDQFQGEFNVSGFHKEILDLTEKTNSIWGIDRCLRIQDIPDEIHSFLFHMGIFARSVNLENIFIDPFKDPRFHELQKDIISQFLELLSLFKANFQELEITYFDGADFGATNKGRDRILKRRYKFPSDSFSKNFLKGKVKLFPLKSIMNLDINPIEGSLVGPRMEVAYNGMEIATIVFNCFKVKNGVLVPVNYIGGYAIGIERLASSLKGSGFMSSIPRYKITKKLLGTLSKATQSSLLERETSLLIYGAEVFANLPNKLSKHRKDKVKSLELAMHQNLDVLGLNSNFLKKLILTFKK